MGVSWNISSNGRWDRMDGNPKATSAQRNGVGILDFGRRDCGTDRSAVGSPAIELTATVKRSGNTAVNEVEPTNERALPSGV